MESETAATTIVVPVCLSLRLGLLDLYHRLGLFDLRRLACAGDGRRATPVGWAPVGLAASGRVPGGFGLGFGFLGFLFFGGCLGLLGRDGEPVPGVTWAICFGAAFFGTLSPSPRFVISLRT